MTENFPVLRTRALALFYQEIASLVSSGISIVEAMDILSGHPGFRRFKLIAVKIKGYLDNGMSLTEAFARFPDVFPSWHIYVIEYSEKAGKLSQGFGSLSGYMQRDYSTQLSLVAGLAYPVLLLHVFIFLYPLASILSGTAARYFAQVFRAIILIYGSLALAYIIFRLMDRRELRAVFHRFILGIPIYGAIMTRMSVARFILALHALCDSGVPIVSGWKMAALASGNEAIRERLLNGVGPIEQGEGLSKAFIRSGICDYSMIGLIKTAEKTGNIVQALNTIYTYCDKEIDTVTKIIARILPVIIYLFIAGFIAFRIISFYFGYFNQALPF